MQLAESAPRVDQHLTLKDRFLAVRSLTESLASCLSAEDQTVQSMPMRAQRNGTAPTPRGSSSLSSSCRPFRVTESSIPNTPTFSIPTIRALVLDTLALIEALSRDRERRRWQSTAVMWTKRWQGCSRTGPAAPCSS